MIRARHLTIIAGAALLCVLRSGIASAADLAPLANDDLIVTCGPAPPGHRILGKRDYRQRNANVVNQRHYTAHEWAHIWPARAKINSGKNLDVDVMNNLPGATFMMKPRFKACE